MDASSRVEAETSLEDSPPVQGETFRKLKGKISKSTLKAIKDMGFIRMTKCQSEVIPSALEGDDLICTAQTGAGKTLAFLVPIVETNITKQDMKDVSSIIIAPTRELAIQTMGVVESLLTYHNFKACLLIGGESRKKQVKKLSQGVDIVIATPGRLLDHMKANEFHYKNLKCLVIDEADKIMQYGFEEELKSIIKMLPKDRQTMLFSATESEKTEKLTALALKEEVTFVHVDKHKDEATVDGLKHGYVICETENRLWWLFKMVKKTRKKKVMVFFSSCKAVEFYHQLFWKHCNAPVKCLHGKLDQNVRTSVAQDFYDTETGTLFCTDVAARGLDFPSVDWIIQFDPPSDVNEYIHRVGRTARGIGAKGNAVLLLRPDEKEFVECLNQAKVYLEPYEKWLPNDQFQILVESLVNDNDDLKKLAEEAYDAFIKAYQVRKMKTIFNIMSLDLIAVAKSFGLKQLPSDAAISLGFKKKHRARKRDTAELQSNKKLKQ